MLHMIHNESLIQDFVAWEVSSGWL